MILRFFRPFFFFFFFFDWEPSSGRHYILSFHESIILYIHFLKIFINQKCQRYCGSTFLDLLLEDFVVLNDINLNTLRFQTAAQKTSKQCDDLSFGSSSRKWR